MKPICCVLATMAIAINSPAWAQELDASADGKALLPNSKITLTKATIEDGKLVIEGTTATPKVKVTLDGQFNDTSAADKKFKFSVIYLPTCLVELKTPSGSDGAVIALCGRKGVNFVSVWSATTDYVTDDLVTLDGSTWRAKRANKSKHPGANAGYWEIFAAKGAVGSAGPRGLPGAPGPAGEQGPAGSVGPRGFAGPAGSANIVVVTRICSGVASTLCNANCDSGQTLLSAVGTVSKNGTRASAELASIKSDGSTGISFTTPTTAYDQYAIRLVCLVP